MGQAHQMVKDAADYVSARNDEGGVAQAIELILANGRLP
jgi:hydroxymethylpyrimidine pyrophosphatase-like HAD family hydrolase